MSVEDFVWHREFLELLEGDEALLEALHGEVALHRVKCHYFESGMTIRCLRLRMRWRWLGVRIRGWLFTTGDVGCTLFNMTA